MSQASVETRPLPSGTVTFLFTDIEGSTERWERHREAMKDAVRRHEEILNAAIAAHGGAVFKTVGDAFCASFQTAPAAIAAALDAQRALLKEDFKSVEGLTIRTAIHTGLSHERGGDYYGPTVNRVARLLSIGHGGQVLVSGASADLSQGDLPEQAALRDLGAHRLKDLTHPEQVYQLVAPGLPPEFPPLRSLEALPNNLPLQITSFVGRDVEILTIGQTLAKQRLVTLVGAGGVGKTRLALQVGADLLEQYEDGVWLLEQAPISDGTLIPSALASIFQVREGEDRSITEALVNALKLRRTLIIFDNCEHVVEAAARLIDTILRNCPNIRIVATSRQGLGIAGESVHRVASLAVPDRQADLTAEEAMNYGAIALFVERAIAATDSFRLTDQNVAIVARLCQRLDGIALAIELATPRLKALSVEQLETKLNERFRILTGGSRTALPRQQTMRALVDWSYELLTDDEKTIFRRVAVFSGGWTLDAATAICSDEKIEDWQVLDILQSLVDKSMVVAELLGSEQRYRLLESTRQYAHELLEKSGELEPMQTRHAAYFHDFGKKVGDSYLDMPTKAWLALMVPENDNFRAVVDWALGEKQDIETGASLAAHLGQYWRLTSYGAEGRARIEMATVICDQLKSKDTVARLWLAKAILSSLIVGWESLEAIADRAVKFSREVGDDVLIAQALRQLAEAHLRQQHHDEAAAILNEAAMLAERANKRQLLGIIKASIARNYNFQGKVPEARAAYAEALSIARAHGDDRGKGVIVANLAEIEFNTGNPQRAIELATEILDIPGDRYITLNNLAAYNIALGNLDEARLNAQRALRLLQDIQSSVHTAISIMHCAAIAAHGKNATTGARLFGYASYVFEADAVPLEPTEKQEYVALPTQLRQELGASEFDRLCKEGAGLSEEQAIEESMRV
ncbi:MAG TPA: adenylate/guanylate cyclase domain-containing protein [Candidatus Acidoferrales bacterium]|nr:adenylate/guanylate cyclase domain-containing protein [Candidatus Acidoferrales bacterium]